ncbi:sterile alpha motif (SAM) domain-containing protein [Actinidia rufa]|uniref:Sterile alpha motif (SAM) domain-containing protein n=1 Tax=Actinidia rufa TaxID=165716 RepID=A0A7J0FKF9_9ERIC|nr:sterile alpha motif (SAM) domain-containing protein [Actinidia rufa]
MALARMVPVCRWHFDRVSGVGPPSLLRSSGSVAGSALARLESIVGLQDRFKGHIRPALKFLLDFPRFRIGLFCGSGPFAYILMIKGIVDVGLWLEEINLGSYRQIFKENGVNGEYLEGMSMFTTEQILRFIRRCHMKWGDFITLCKELRRIKVACLKGEQKVRRPWWAPSCLSVVFAKAAKRNRQARVVSLKLEP